MKNGLQSLSLLVTHNRTSYKNQMYYRGNISSIFFRNSEMFALEFLIYHENYIVLSMSATESG